MLTMSARAPAAIYQLWADVSKLIPPARLGGIVGDVAHSFGYHLARRDLPADDYSVQLAADKLGANDCASALDISLGPDLMKTCTKRLVDAARAGDPRLKALREFCGTLDGQHTYPWQLTPANESEGLDTWDDSHLWHIHLSFLREFADDYAALAPIANVIAGVPAEKELTMDAEVKARFDALEAKLAALADLFVGHDGAPHHVEVLARVGAKGGTFKDATSEWYQAADHKPTPKKA